MVQGPLPYPDSAEPAKLLDWGQKLIVWLKREQSQDFPFSRNKSYPKAKMPPADQLGAAGATIFVTDDVGGATLAFSDGTNWRRVSDRAVIA